MVQLGKPTVLHVYKDFYPPVLGGIEKCIHTMCDETREAYSVRVLVASRSRHTVDEDIDGIRVIRAGCLGRVLSAPLAPGFAGWLRRLDSDILHFHMPNPTGELAYLLARPPRGRVVVTYHSDIVRQRLTGRLYAPLQQRFLSQARLIMPTSRQYLESSATLRPHLDRCQVAPLGIPLDALEETEASRAYTNEIRQRADGRTVIAFIGLLRYYKGIDILLRALACLPASVCLFIAGAVPSGRERERRDLEKLAGELGIADRAFFLGEISEAQAVGIRHSADLFCLPSHLRGEAFGLTQIEAMACGLPVVGTDLAGVSEVNLHDRTGLVVRAGSVEALRAALARLAEDPEMRLRMGQAARLHARTVYSAQAMGERLRRAYSDARAPQREKNAQS